MHPRVTPFDVIEVNRFGHSLHFVKIFDVTEQVRAARDNSQQLIQSAQDILHVLFRRE